MGKSEKVQKNCGKLGEIVDLTPPPPPENPGTQNCPTPTGGGGVGQSPSQPASQPATKAMHKTQALDRVSEILKHVSGLVTVVVTTVNHPSRMMKQKSLTNVKNCCPQ